MAVLPTDFSVSSTRTSPIPNPNTSVSIPVIKGAEDAASVGKPVAKNAQSAATLNVPLVFTGQDFADIAAPSVKASLPNAAISDPVIVDSQAQTNIDTPNLISDEESLNIANPDLINDQTQPSIANPSLVNDQDSAAISAPSVKSSITQPSIANPVLVNDQTQPNIANPVLVNDQTQPNIANPVLVNDQDSASISAPSAITSSVTDLVAPPFPLNHARILYENELFDYSSITSDLGGTPAYAANPNTWQRWNFNGSGYIKFTLPANKDVDTICIGAHNLGSGGYTITPYYRATNGGALTLFDSAKVVTTNNSIMFHVGSEVSAKVIEIYASVGTDDAFIGYMSAGVALQMQRPFFGGHTPITDATVTKFYDSWTESGNIIGRSKRSQGQETTADFKNIDDGWYRNYFQGFKESALTLPYFFAWNLLEYPDDVGLCYTDSDISAPYVGTRALRSISFTLKGAL